MRPDQAEKLRAEREGLAQDLQRLLDESEPADPKAARRRVRELAETQRTLGQLDSLLKTAERSAARAPRAAKPAEAGTADDGAVVARFALRKGAEVRVMVKTWQGRRTVDVRCWVQPADAPEPRPTRKGLQLDVKRLPELIDALKQAQQFV